jgi:hypothetical protein
MKPSQSPDRHTFQKTGYLKRCEEKGEDPNQDYLGMFEQVLEDAGNKWNDPENKINNLEWDLVTTGWILAKVRASDVYAQNLYAAMCNNDFQKLDVFPILKDQRWSCSWRYAGGIVADMQQKGDYIDWYCSGIRDNYDNGYVSESFVTDEIKNDLEQLGWIVLDNESTK